MMTMTCGRAGARAGAAAGVWRARGRGFGLGGGTCGAVEARVADAALEAGDAGTGGDAVLVVTSALVDVPGAVVAGWRRDDADDEGAPVCVLRDPSSPPITTALTAARMTTNKDVVATLALFVLRA